MGLPGRRRAVLYFRQQGFVQPGRGKPAGVVLIDMGGGVQHVHDPLFLHHRGEGDTPGWSPAAMAPVLP